MSSTLRFRLLIALLSGALFVVFDFVWLTQVVLEFNLGQLEKIGRIDGGRFDVLLEGAVVAYILMALSIAIFVVPPDSRIQSERAWLLWTKRGLAMGLMIFGVYDATNIAILRDYPLPFAFVDVAWGTVMFGLVSGLVGKIATSRQFLRISSG